MAARPGRKPAGDTTFAADYAHCQTVYRMMMDESKKSMDEEGNDIIIWEGMLTSLITGRCNLSIPYYTKITRALKQMGCIRQLKRGGGTGESIWELITEPTMELFEKRPSISKVPMQNKMEQFAMQLDALSMRVNALERALQKFIDEEIANG